MAIVGRTATLVEDSSTQSITGTLPADRAAGDLCVAVCAIDSSSGTLTGPSGWTQIIAPITLSASTPNVLAAYYRRDPPSGPNFATSSPAGRASVIVQAYGGVNVATPIDVTAVASSGDGSSLVATGVTTVTNEARIISAFGVNSSSRDISTPAGMTMVKKYSATTNGRALALADEVDVTAGATGTRTWTYTPSSTLSMGAFITALRPGNSLTFTASTTSTGVVRKVVGKNWAGTSTATGALTRTKVVVKALTATITPAGAFAKTMLKPRVASVTASGTTVKVTTKSPFTGSTTGTGFYRTALVRVFTASVTTVGTLTTTALGRVVGRAGHVLVSARAFAEVAMRIRRS